MCSAETVSLRFALDYLSVWFTSCGFVDTSVMHGLLRFAETVSLKVLADVVMCMPLARGYIERNVKRIGCLPEAMQNGFEAAAQGFCTVAKGQVPGDVVTVLFLSTP
ncbi:hypothetical protein Tco_0475023 [Tanacetum coccineum]